MFGKLFSKRNQPPPERYSYIIPAEVRSRLVNTFRFMFEEWPLSTQSNFPEFCTEIGKQLLIRTGTIKARPETARNPEQAVPEHFFRCSDEEACDFLELCLEAKEFWYSGAASKLVAEWNRIFEEEGIGFELTQPSQEEMPEATRQHGNFLPGGKAYRPIPSRIIKKADQIVHQKTVQPALQLLNDSRFLTANEELLDSFEKVKKSDYAGAITSCGASFESVMKTICTIKGWTYDADKDTCAVLVKILKDHGLFFPFYTPILDGVGIVRNKISRAHGKGPAPKYKADREHAEHMIAMTCSHIDFIIRMAKL